VPTLLQSPVAPQCARLLDGSTQVPPQLTSPAWQVNAHLPALHTWPAPQTLPAPPPPLPQPGVAPQKRRLVLGSTHVPVQLTNPVSQESEHSPALHTSPAAQAWPDVPPSASQSAVAPQWSRSLAGSMHAPSHFTSPEGQVSVQAPPEQTSLTPQMTPLPVQAVAPQRLRSWLGSTHAPAHNSHPSGHAQAPAAQCWPSAHAAPAEPASTPQPSEAPQCWRSTVGSTQVVQHFTCPLGQVFAQAPLLQTCSASHALPQAPQSSWLVVMSTHAPPQATWGTTQVRTHVPWSQILLAEQGVLH
jgi:hypothetical protein